MKSTSNNLLSAFAEIWRLSHRCQLEPVFFDDIQPTVRYISNKLKLKSRGEHLSMQCIILSLLIDAQEPMTCKAISEFLCVSNIQLLAFNQDFEKLVELRMIRCLYSMRRGEPSRSYCIETEFVEAVKSNKKYEPRDYSQYTAREVLRHINRQLDIASHECDYYNQMVREIKFLIEKTQHTEFSKHLLSLPISDPELVLFLIIASLQIFKRMSAIGPSLYNDILEESFCVEDLCNSINDDEGRLVKHNLLENAMDDGIKMPDYFRLTENACKTVLKEFNYCPSFTQEKTIDELIQPDKITEKTLYYNKEEKLQLQRLTDLLDVERLAIVQQRLKEAGKQVGICALLHGVAGGGKTESVYQMARRTNHPIFMVDAAALKSKYVGDSEKNVRALFAQYDQMVSTCNVQGRPIPILLFNECDAIMGRRMIGAQHSIDKMENAIQNIILQAMETFRGIMIATSNLADTNLDGAFERRFLIKVNFRKPESEVKAKIWKAMLPDLSDDCAMQLSSCFDFTGGEIDNVTRKLTIDKLLYDQEYTLDHIVSVCQEEGALKAQHHSIGFV